MTNRIRGRTLGSYLRGEDGERTSGTSEAIAGAVAYNPGFPAEVDLSLPTSPDASRNPLLDPGQIGTQDLKYSHMEAFSMYARSLTRASSNALHSPDIFAGGPGSAPKRGDVIPTTDGENTFTGRTFVPPGAKSYFDTISNDSFFGEQNITALGLTGMKTSSGLDANKGVFMYIDPAQLSLTSGKVSEILDQKNMYSPNPDASPYTKYVPGGTNPASNMDEFYNELGLYSIQTGQQGDDKFGHFDKNAPRMTVSSLRSMIYRSLMKASGESSPANSIGNYVEASAQKEAILGAFEDATSNLTNMTQIGVDLINVADLSMRKQAAGLDGGEPAGSGPGSEDMKKAIERLSRSLAAEDFTYGIGKSSYTSDSETDKTIGSLTNPGEHFSGFFPLGMFMTVVVGLLAFVLIGALIESLLSREEPKLPGDASDSAPWNYELGGAYQRGAGNDLIQFFMKLFGWPEIQSDANFVSAFFRGAMRWYGFNFDLSDTTMTPTPVLLMDLFESLINVALAPGYYAVMQRVIMRDLNTIGEAFGSVGGAGSGGGFMTFMQLMAAIETLFTSTTFRWLIVCIGLGDKAYDAKYSPGRAHTGIKSGVPTITRERVGYPLTPGSRMYLSRWYKKGADGKVADVMSPMSLRTFQSLINGENAGLGELGLKKHETAEEALTHIEKQNDETAEKNEFSMASLITMPNSVNPNRISSELVRQYEEYLDNEYCPFYVHDLRTNEIIALPAFITNVSEQFGVDYTETGGYGRTDKIKGYNSTTRSIDISFILAAMNPKDMQYMWFVIEKLVTMCYPQRSTGKVRHMAGGTGQFVQPFSQIPTATPVVRLRLGELLHTNYNIQRLARLFGDQNHNLLNTTIETSTQNKEYWDNMKKRIISDEAIAGLVKADILDRVEKGTADGLGTEITFSAGSKTKVIFDDQKRGSEGGSSLGAAAVAALAGGEKTAFNTGTVRGYIHFTIEGRKSWTPTPKPSTSGKKEKGDEQPPEPAPQKDYYEIVIDFTSTNNPKRKHSKKKAYGYFVRTFGKRVKGSKKRLKADLTAVKALVSIDDLKAMKLNTGNPGPGFAKAVEDKKKNLLAAQGTAVDNALKASKQLTKDGFFNPDKNPIVRAFNASMGAGLAGVITNMSLNYDGATYGTDSLDNDRAPKKVEVQLSFSPIHDLPLGLDYAGRIIAPAHGVGVHNSDPHAEYVPAADGKPPVKAKAPAGQPAADTPQGESPE